VRVTVRRVIPGLAVIALCLGCGRELEAPPVQVLERDSLIGAGKVVQIKSMTNEELRAVEVTIAAKEGEMVYREERLGPYETLEVGWKKLGGWEIPDDAEIRVRAQGYLLPYRARLAAAESKP
jgi:hypothetical protein